MSTVPDLTLAKALEFTGKAGEFLPELAEAKKEALRLAEDERALTELERANQRTRERVRAMENHPTPVLTPVPEPTR